MIKGAFLVRLSASLALDASAKTKVMFFFDTEDYICDRSNDAIRDIANLLSSEGVRGNFNIAGFLATRIVELGRTDVIEALKPHVIGTQTLYHLPYYLPFHLETMLLTGGKACPDFKTALDQMVNEQEPSGRIRTYFIPEPQDTDDPEAATTFLPYGGDWYNGMASDVAALGLLAENETESVFGDGRSGRPLPADMTLTERIALNMGRLSGGKYLPERIFDRGDWGWPVDFHEGN